jgi:hypothetical protein
MSFERNAVLLDKLVDSFVADYVPYPPGLSMLVQIA